MGFIRQPSIYLPTFAEYSDPLCGAALSAAFSGAGKMPALLQNCHYGITLNNYISLGPPHQIDRMDRGDPNSEKLCFRELSIGAYGF
jgi:hypothetical protein